MPISKDQSVLVRFGPYTADTKSGELRKHGVRIPLQVQPFQILQVFLEGGIRHSEGLGQRTDRMKISLEFDYLANRRFAVRGFTDWRHSFDGIGSLEDLTTPELALTHDRLLKASYWHLCGGVGFLGYSEDFDQC